MEIAQSIECIYLGARGVTDLHIKLTSLRNGNCGLLVNCEQLCVKIRKTR